MSIKTARISDALIEEISYIIANKVKNKDINFVTITDVTVSSDLSYAKVYFTVLDQVGYRCYVDEDCTKEFSEYQIQIQNPESEVTLYLKKEKEEKEEKE